MTDDENQDVAHAEPGAWLPLADAIRALEITEYQAYRYVREDKLRAREWNGGRIEVWVADAARPSETSHMSLTSGADHLSLDVIERLAAMFHQHIGQLLQPLAEAHERSLELARENGALTERLSSSERSSRVAENTGDDPSHLEALRERIRDVEAANARLTAMLEARAPREEAMPPELPRQESRLLVIGAVVLAIITVAFLIVVFTNIVHPRTIFGPPSSEQGFEGAVDSALSVGRPCSPEELQAMLVGCRR